jgi:hypothetical protein
VGNRRRFGLGVPVLKLRVVFPPVPWRAGPKEFQYCGKTFHRSDITLVNKRNLKLQCSHWEPVDRCARALRFLHASLFDNRPIVRCYPVIGLQMSYPVSSICTGTHPAVLRYVVSTWWCCGGWRVDVWCCAQCLDSLDVAFGIGATMFALDCAGSGQSEGQYVTLGEFEKDDVATVCVLVPPPAG